MFPVAFFPPRRFLSSTARGKTERTREYTQALKISPSTPFPPPPRPALEFTRTGALLSFDSDPLSHSSRRNSSREHHETQMAFPRSTGCWIFPLVEREKRGERLGDVVRSLNVHSNGRASARLILKNRPPFRAFLWGGV